MVAPIRDFGNISSSTTALYSTTSNMSPNNTLNMIINSNNEFFKKNCDFSNEVRGCSLAYSTYYSRTPSMSSSECDKNYAIKVQRESDRMDEDDPVALSNSPQLKYTTSNSQSNQVSKAADFTTNARQQCTGH